MNKIKTCIKKNRKKLLIWAMVFVTMLTTLCTGTLTAKAEDRELKIGYDSNSNFIKEDKGEYYGYGVEYLEKIAEYTDWDYTYVNDVSWHASMEKLRNGEIDLICTAHYTEERAEEFLYSDIPLGYETTILYTTTDSEIGYQDYEAMNGCKVGLLADSYSAEEFIEYAEKHEITCETVYYQRENIMLKALESGEIDILAVGSRYATQELQMVDRLGANAFYCITNKENADLIEEIENVLQQIMFDDPKFEGELNEKYFGHNAISNTPLYTKEELAFIENAETIKLKIMMNQRPSCYIENGEVKGIWVEYLNLLSEKSGIHFDIEAGVIDDNTESYYDELLEQGYLLFRTVRTREYNNRTDENLVTNPLADIKISYLVCQDEFMQEQNKEQVVAMTKDLSYAESLLLRENDGYQFIYFDKAQDCLEALVNKEVDMVVQNAYWASYLMQKPEYADKLTEVPGTDYNNKIVLVANEDQQILIDILNKAINHISEEEKEEIVTRELLLNPYPLTLSDVWYQYWEWIMIIVIAIVGGLIVYTIMTQRMTALKVQKKEYEWLQKKIQLDELTGLYNRTYFFEKVRTLIDNTDEEMCIVMMNILNFKVINELYGMITGDRILKEIGDQVAKRVNNKPSVLAARFMADYYFICLPKALFEKIELPSRLQTSLNEIDIKVVYGVFVIGDQKDLPINIMCDRANTAAHDKDYAYTEYVHYYNDAQRQKRMLEQEIENDMEKAIENREFAAYIQPKYDVASGKIVGGEALVRWFHPTKGMISPGLFISIFEKNGFIVQLDYYVWEETCAMLAEFKKAGLKTVPISINVSKAHFYGNDLRAKLHELVQKYGLETWDLELEITESICAEDSNVILIKIGELQQDGFRIAMDDFGSGYSSLNMLKEIPLDIIKMDLKFLDSKEESELKSRYILKSLIDLAQAMDLKVVVEGVETESQVQFLIQFYECVAQGYYFSRPVDCKTYRELLENENK